MVLDFGLKTCGSLGNNMDLNTKLYGLELGRNCIKLALLENEHQRGQQGNRDLVPKKKQFLVPILETLGIGPISMQGKDVFWYLKIRKDIVVI